jgi:hypothetical protein
MVAPTMESALTDSSREHRTPAQIKKAQRNEDRNKALTDYETEAAAIRAKTARLKALRIARDAAAPAPAPSGAGRARKPAKGTAKAKAAGTLADWLTDRQKDGHS